MLSTLAWCVFSVQGPCCWEVSADLFASLFALGRPKERRGSGWRTRLWENWMMPKSLMAWPERRPSINAEESWTQRCVTVCTCVCVRAHVYTHLLILNPQLGFSPPVFLPSHTSKNTHNFDLYLSDATFQWCVWVLRRLYFCSKSHTMSCFFLLRVE